MKTTLNTGHLKQEVVSYEPYMWQAGQSAEEVDYKTGSAGHLHYGTD